MIEKPVTEKPGIEKPQLRYRLLLFVLSPWLLFKVTKEAFAVRSGRFLLQRFGISFNKIEGRPVWIHCASVGEVNAARPLVNSIRQRLPEVPIVISTTTPTGASTVSRQAWGNVEHVYLPVDFYRPVCMALGSINPRALIIMETEIWPNLILGARKQKIPVLIANGRLSDRTLKAPDWLKLVYRQVLPQVSAILCKTDKDANGFKQLGANSDTVQTIGNIKFALPAYQPVACEVERQFWLAASTHEDEELQIFRALRDNPIADAALLIIAPRHPQRSEKIQQQILQCGIRYAVRSKSQLPDENTQVYLADTLGEMNQWLSAAKLVFVGGSLVPVGGHNLLEPAAAGVAVLSGKHVDNVLDEAELLTQSGAMQQVQSVEELIETAGKILSDSDLRKKMEKAGMQTVLKNADVLDHYMEQILPFIADA